MVSLKGKSNASARSFHCLLRLLERVLGTHQKTFFHWRKGRCLERLTQLYLQTVPEYQSELAHIWTLREVPPDVRKLLALPTLDEGIDFIARSRHGKYWAIQSKFRSQRDKPLTRRELGTFTSLVFNTCNNIALAVVSHTATKPVSKRHLMRNTVEISLALICSTAAGFAPESSPRSPASRA